MIFFWCGAAQQLRTKKKKQAPSDKKKARPSDKKKAEQEKKMKKNNNNKNIFSRFYIGVKKKVFLLRLS